MIGYLNAFTLYMLAALAAIPFAWILGRERTSEKPN